MHTVLKFELGSDVFVYLYVIPSEYENVTGVTRHSFPLHDIGSVTYVGLGWVWD